MVGPAEKTIARVWSQYEQVKNHVSNLHIDYVSAVMKIQAAHISGRSHTVRHHRIAAFQSLAHLRHFAVLSGAIQDRADKDLLMINTYLTKWNDITPEQMLKVVDWFENWFAQSYFYDVRVNEENRQIVDIEATMKLAGL